MNILNSKDRHSIRLKGYDYRPPGGYYITLVSWQRECIFGQLIDGKIQLNSVGKIIKNEWEHLPYKFTQTRLNHYIVMPNHFHGIIMIEDAGATHSTSPYNEGVNVGSPLPKQPPKGPPQNSLVSMIGQFKSRATKRIWSLPGMKKRPIWQRNYYDHIIRNDDELQKIILYIETNPEHWQDDQFYPSTPKNKLT